MRFIDEVQITVSSGKGGDGCVSFRREKFVPRGGPDGGDGGDGGSVYFQGARNLNTLVKFRGQKNYAAEPGESGKGRQKHGRSGEDIVLQVPVGTIVRNLTSGEIIADIVDTEASVLVAKGGKGGAGNVHFKSSVNQAPRKHTPGESSVTFELELELKLLADIALIGLPNAGKSTCIASISAARPKVADYPFTTLEPNLGVVKMDDENSWVVADIPGLIEKASEGKGLGTKFLKHIERTKALVHLVDISWCLDEFEAFEQYVTIREELNKYGQGLTDKREIVCLTKVDTMLEQEFKKFVQFFEEQLGQKVLPFSAVSGKNAEALKGLMLEALTGSFCES